MAAVPAPIHQTAAAIHALHAKRAAAEESRPYLGWSSLGEECDRALWLAFRWAGREVIEGRIARLFETGHREEARVLQELRDLGMEVWDRDEDGRQFGVSSLGGHLRGHLDAVVRGLEEAPKTPHLVDVKTIKAKKFDELLKKGMRAMYPKYWVQAQGYMGHKQLERAMFIFVCKDDDRIHCERFEFDKATFDASEDRALRVIQASEPPLRLSDDPSYFGCKFCSFHAQCHGTEAPLVNCRTCAHSTPQMDGDGRWTCDAHKHDIAVRAQRTACSSHRFIPILLERFAKPIDMDGDGVRYEMNDGRGEFVNGEPPAGFTSHEIHAAADKGLLVAEEVRTLRAQIKTTRITA